MFEDIAVAIRGLRRNPTFAVLAALVLGIGIGATTTVFSAVDSILLRPLPYAKPDRIFAIVLKQGPETYGDSLTEIMFRFIRDRQQSFSALAADAQGSGINLVSDSGAAYVRTLSVKSDYFRVFAVEPALGQSFTREEEDPGAPPAAILSYGLWQSRFGGRADIVGQQVRFMDKSYAVVGVMPETFRPFFPVDVWTPLKTNDPRGSGFNYSAVGRLKDGVTVGQAAAEMAALTIAFLQERPRGATLPDRVSLGIEPLQKFLNAGIGSNVLILFGAVLAILLIMCANTASLTLVRAFQRQREFAIRTAIGASRWRIVRQVWIESLLLSALGSIVGLGLAEWGIGVLVSLDPAAYSAWNPGIDLRVLGATVAAAVIVGIVVGLLPAFQSVRIGIQPRLLEEGRQSSSHRVTLWRRLLVTVEVAACLVLLTGAGLLIRSFVNFLEVPLGFDGRNVLTAQMSLHGGRYDEGSRAVSFIAESLDQIRALPGVEAAGIASNLPAQRGLNVPFRTPQGGLAAPDWRYITPDYFKVFRIRLVRGRYLQEMDQLGTPAVAVVNEQFVRRFFPGGEVLGTSLVFPNDNTNFSFEVVGVIGDVKSGNFRAAAAPTVFVTLKQAPMVMRATAHEYYPVNFVIRTASNTQKTELASALSRFLRSVEPDLPLASVQTMDEVVGTALRPQRAQTMLLSVFAALALITSASGIYGLISYSMVMRTREFGIRIALGATYSKVIASIVRQGFFLAVIGTAFGLAGSLFASRLLRTYLFGVTAKDPWTFAIGSLILVVVSVSASTVPALRVLKLSPSIALREE